MGRKPNTIKVKRVLGQKVSKISDQELYEKILNYEEVEISFDLFKEISGIMKVKENKKEEE